MIERGDGRFEVALMVKENATPGLYAAASIVKEQVSDFFMSVAFGVDPMAIEEKSHYEVENPDRGGYRRDSPYE